MSQYQTGITAPPFHPRCRGTTVPHIDDDYGERAARNHAGETYYVPADMKYEEWYETYVRNTPIPEKRLFETKIVQKKQTKWENQILLLMLLEKMV